MVEIESGVPLPPPRGGRSRYPFAKMAPGDSFFVEADQRHVAAAASEYGKAHGWRFATRKVAGGTRCWRTE